MAEDDRGGVVQQGSAHYFPGVDRGRVDGTGAHIRTRGMDVRYAIDLYGNFFFLILSIPVLRSQPRMVASARLEPLSRREAPVGGSSVNIVAIQIGCSHV